MGKIYIIRNEDVNQALVGIPMKHRHLRACVKLKMEA